MLIHLGLSYPNSSATNHSKAFWGSSFFFLLTWAQIAHSELLWSPDVCPQFHLNIFSETESILSTPSHKLLPNFWIHAELWLPWQWEEKTFKNVLLWICSRDFSEILQGCSLGDYQSPSSNVDRLKNMTPVGGTFLHYMPIVQTLKISF